MNFFKAGNTSPVLMVIMLFMPVAVLTAPEFEDDIIFQRLGIEQGLSQNTAFCILQDSKGFMWFGTEDGLNRYDGYRFRVFKEDLLDTNSISANYILAIHEDKKGNLWIGTDGGGLNRYNPQSESFTAFVNIPGDSNSLSNNRVTSLCEDDSGNIWAGTQGGGLSKLDPRTQTFVHYSSAGGLSDNNVNTLISDKQGILWIGTDNGLNKFNPYKESFSHYYADINDYQSLSASRIRTLHIDQKGTLWIGTAGGGLNKLIKATKNKGDTFVSYKKDFFNPASIGGNNILSIFEDRSGVLWIGTDGYGLNRMVVDKDKNSAVTFVHYISDPSDVNTVANNEIYSIYEDISGVLWIGTKGGGISKYDRQKKKFAIIRNKPNESNSISNNAVRFITEDNNGNLWIGSDGGGLDHYEIASGQYTHYRHDPGNQNSISHNYIRSVEQDRNGNIWIGTDGGGVNLLDPATGKIKHYHHNSRDKGSISSDVIRPILQDRHGLIWIGTLGGGLNSFDAETGSFKHYRYDPADSNSISHDYIYTIYEDRLGTLWVGTDGGGLCRYNREKDNFSSFKHDPANPGSLSQDNVYTIYEDDWGIFWLGTRGGGLNRFNPHKQIFRHYTEMDGLPNQTIYGILGDEKGNLWMSTNKGLSRFDPDKEEFKNYDVNDGLQSNEFNGGAYYKSENGMMYFGGINGMNTFFPDEIKDNPNIPPVVITDFQIFNKAVPIGKDVNKRKILDRSIVETGEIELTWEEKVFSFEFAALNYVAPEKNQYAYMLENFDDEWNYIENRRFISYTNIPAGDYTLHVKASNSDGVWNEQGTQLKIIIHPPFWQTLWFRVLMFAIFVVAVYLIYRIRVRAIRQRSHELEENVKKRTKQATMLYETGRRLSSQLDLDSLLAEIVRSIFEAFNYNAVMLLLPDKNENTFSMRSAAGDFKDEFSGMTVKEGRGMIGKAASTREIQISGDVRKDPNFIQRANEKTQSELSVPIISADRVIGVLDIQSDKMNAFEGSDIAAMETLSTHIASALENARLFEQAQQEISDRKKAENNLRHAKKETDNILQNVNEGLFLLDKFLNIESQYSAALEEILAEKKLSRCYFLNYLKKKVDLKVIEDTANYLDLMLDNSVDEDTLIKLNPLSQIEFTFKDKNSKQTYSKFLTFAFRRIVENETTAHIMVTVSDITEKVLLERDLEKTRIDNKRKMDLIITILNVDPLMLSDFLVSFEKETRQLLAEIKTFKKNRNNLKILDTIYRLIHNIKGNASLLDLDFYANKAHEVEDYLQKLKGLKKITVKDLDNLCARANDFISDHNEVQELIEQLSQLQKHLQPKGKQEKDNLIKSLEKLVYKLNFEYNKKARLDTKNFRGEIVPPNQKLLIRDILVQLIRNSMSHGIEVADLRKKEGKDPFAKIEIKNYIKNNHLYLMFEDDGRGLDLEKLQKKALEIGSWPKEEIESWDRDKIAEVIYTPGVTTTNETTLESGRGIGMDIIKNKIREYKGSIHVESMEGKYCQFSIILPLN